MALLVIPRKQLYGVGLVVCAAAVAFGPQAARALQGMASPGRVARTLESIGNRPPDATIEFRPGSFCLRVRGDDGNGSVARCCAAMHTDAYTLKSERQPHSGGCG